jgi:hypothetical protein
MSVFINSIYFTASFLRNICIMSTKQLSNRRFFFFVVVFFCTEDYKRHCLLSVLISSKNKCCPNICCLLLHSDFWLSFHKRTYKMTAENYDGQFCGYRQIFRSGFCIYIKSYIIRFFAVIHLLLYTAYQCFEGTHFCKNFNIIITLFNNNEKFILLMQI